MSRTYKIGKENYVSVTTVIGDYDTGGLMQWAANEAVAYIKKVWEESVAYGDDFEIDEDILNKARYAYKEISKEATDIGTEVHDYCEAYIKNQIEPIDKRDLVAYISSSDTPQFNGVGSFLKWVAKTNPEFIESELTVHSDTYKYAGTLDCVCRLDGKLYIIDFKTSKAHYPKNAVQIAAYKYAYEEMTEEFVDGVGVLRLDKVTGEYDWKDYTKVVVRQMETFLGLLKAWNNFKKRRL